jgi:hypothetical protein
MSNWASAEGFAVETPFYTHRAAAQPGSNIAVRDLIQRVLETKGVVVGHLPSFDMTETGDYGMLLV